MRLNDHRDVVALLERRGVAHQDAGEGRWLQIAAEPEPIMVRWEPDAAVVQVMQPLFATDAGERGAVCERIVALNHVLAMPGFGMDPDTGIVYFRLSVPRHLDGTLAEVELTRLIETVTTTAREHAGALRG